MLSLRFVNRMHHIYELLKRVGTMRIYWTKFWILWSLISTILDSFPLLWLVKITFDCSRQTGLANGCSISRTVTGARSSNDDHHTSTYQVDPENPDKIKQEYALWKQRRWEWNSIGVGSSWCNKWTRAAMYSVQLTSTWNNDDKNKVILMLIYHLICVWMQLHENVIDCVFHFYRHVRWMN